MAKKIFLKNVLMYYPFNNKDNLLYDLCNKPPIQYCFVYGKPLTYSDEYGGAILNGSALTFNLNAWGGIKFNEYQYDFSPKMTLDFTIYPISSQNNSALFKYKFGLDYSIYGGYSYNKWTRITMSFDQTNNTSKLFYNGKLSSKNTAAPIDPSKSSIGFTISTNDAWNGGGYVNSIIKNLAIYRDFIKLDEFDANSNFRNKFLINNMKIE